MSLRQILSIIVLCGSFAEVYANDASPVDPAGYSEFWIWGGVSPQPVLNHARTLYVLAGQIDGVDGATRIVAQRTVRPSVSQADQWLVYRVNTLEWSPKIQPVILAQLRHSSGRVVGVQLDFDAHTRHLQKYLDFLSEFRGWLPQIYKLSVTGLMDWSSRMHSEQVNQLRETIDEIVIQTYQGRHTISNYKAYLNRIQELALPFKIGLVQAGAWAAPEDLRHNSWFRGYVVFLLNAQRV